MTRATACLRRGLTAMALLAVAPTTAPAAPRNADPNWPCQQAKVSELSVASYWSGPAVDPSATGWQQDTAVASLVGVITQRRLPLDQAEVRIASFARTAGAEKNRALLEVFAGVFEVLNRERANVMAGLDRYAERQKALAENLRRDGEALRAAQAASPPDEAKVAELTQRLAWDSEVFESRRQSLHVACDVPAIIEQRLYGLATALQRQLD
jgi:hypothetical protein